MSWHTGPMTAFDLETTGVDPETARIVTATIAHITGPDVQIRSCLVDPGIPIPAASTAVHGITDEQARRDGITADAAVEQILAELENAWTQRVPVVIYNASYDLTVLDRELRRHTSMGIGAIGPVIDPFVIDKALDRYRRGSRKLTDVCAHYGVRLDAAHDATEDALAAARLAWRMAQCYAAELGDLDIVNAKQAAWRADWAANFEDHLRRKGTPELVDPSWPIRPYVPTPACIGADA